MKWYISGIRSIINTHTSLSKDDQHLIVLEISRFICSCCIRVYQQADMPIGTVFHFLDLIDRRFVIAKNQNEQLNQHSTIRLIIAALIISMKIGEEERIYLEDFFHAARFSMTENRISSFSLRTMEEDFLKKLDYKVCNPQPDNIIKLLETHYNKISIELLIIQLKKTNLNHSLFYLDKISKILQRKEKNPATTDKTMSLMSPKKMLEHEKFSLIELKLEQLSRILADIRAATHPSQLNAIKRKICTNTFDFLKYDHTPNIHLFWSPNIETIWMKIMKELSYKDTTLFLTSI